MVQEIRRIILEPDELLSCFESYRRATPDFLPGGRLTGYRSGENLSIVVSLEMIAGNCVQVAECSFKCADLVQPIVYYCLQNNIVLPSKGRTSVGLADGKTTLFIILDYDTYDA